MSGNGLTDRLTGTHDNYHNPRCTSAPRVNYSYLAVVGGPDSSVLLQLQLYTADPPNVHTSPHSQHSLHISSPHLALVSESVLSLQT